VFDIEMEKEMKSIPCLNKQNFSENHLGQNPIGFLTIQPKGMSHEIFLFLLFSTGIVLISHQMCQIGKDYLEIMLGRQLIDLISSK
jgi:hypothetical protein